MEPRNQIDPELELYRQLIVDLLRQWELIEA